MPKTIYNCEPTDLIEKASEGLKKIDSIKPPAWVAIAKTGAHKERPPAKKDWWYVRSASVLRHVYRYGPIGVSKLRRKYGGKKRRGYKTEHFYKGSGNIIRKILQQLDAAGFVRKSQEGVHKGRVISAEGKKFLDSIASQIAPMPKAKKPEAKPAAEQRQKEGKPSDNNEGEETPKKSPDKNPEKASKK